MKKIIFLLLFCTLPLCACSRKEADERAIIAGRDAVNLADEFLNGEESAKVIADKIDIISEGLNWIEYTGESSPDLDIDTRITELSISIDSLPESNVDESGNVLEARNALAELVGIKYRKEDEEVTQTTETSTELDNSVSKDRGDAVPTVL